MPATQDFLQFDHVRDDVILLKNGDLRAVLQVLPINFALKSQDEQDALVFMFEQFLNSLDFDIQVLVHSRKINITPYLEQLRDLAQTQESELLRIQTEQYTEFIETFISEANVMKKEFFVVVPYSLISAKHETSGLLSAVSTLFSREKKGVSMGASQFGAARTQLIHRATFVANGLKQLGLAVTMLSTEELVKLLWGFYNPEKQEVSSMPEGLFAETFEQQEAAQQA